MTSEESAAPTAAGRGSGWDAQVIAALTVLAPAEQVRRVRAAGGSPWATAELMAACDPAALLARLAVRARIEVERDGPSPAARDVVGELLARRLGVVPLRAAAGVLDVATSDPLDLDGERALEFATGRSIRLRLASPATVRRWQDDLYRDPADEVAFASLASPGADRPTGVQSVAEEADEVADAAVLARRADEQPIVRLADQVIADGIAARASDVHVEPGEGGYVVRYRVDGVLRAAVALPRGAGIPLVSRLKVVAGMNIADRLRPQDGRARVSVDGERVDLRVSTLPAAQGEKVVIRVLDARGGVRPLDALGFTDETRGRLEGLLDAREGLVLVTGPTGSGKTTTLYSALGAVRTRGVNVVTVEDPVEYRIAGVSQVQVNERAGLTFASALRAILRQDPDVVLVGEIRDAETASIAVQAALTGHLVFSTLHTIDAAGAVARLVDVGVEPYKIAAALRGVVAQRLVRRCCADCGGSGGAAGVVCAACAGTGFHGRLAASEVLRCTASVAAAIAGGAPVQALAREAERDGMRAMWWSGVDHVAAGRTTIDELRRVCEAPAEHYPAAAWRGRRVAESLPRGPAVRAAGALAGRARRHALQLHRARDG